MFIIVGFGVLISNVNLIGGYLKTVSGYTAQPVPFIGRLSSLTHTMSQSIHLQLG